MRLAVRAAMLARAHVRTPHSSVRAHGTQASAPQDPSTTRLIACKDSQSSLRLHVSKSTKKIRLAVLAAHLEQIGLRPEGVLTGCMHICVGGIVDISAASGRQGHFVLIVPCGARRS